jgi:carbon storage regulator
MLVLTRKLMEKLFIGDNICVTVVRLEGGQVRLGIEAPREISVVRAELVPDRVSGPHRPGHRAGFGAGGGHAHGPSEQGPGAAGEPLPAEPGPPHAHRGEFRTPPASAHGTGSRRRGPSR